MSKSELVIRGLVSDHNVACAACGTRFRRSGLRVVRREQDVYQVSARCTHCRAVSLLLVRMDEEANPVSPELTEGEAERFAATPPIGFDDVLAIGDFLSEFDGDFKKALAESSTEP